MRDEQGRFVKGHAVLPEWQNIFRQANLGATRHTTPHTAETRLKISQNRIGKNVGQANPIWQGGRSRYYKTGYYSKQYLEWRYEVFKKDNYTCQDCEITGDKTYLTAHHIKSFAHYPELRFEVSNGRTLCEPCHEKTDNYKSRVRK